MPRYFKGKGQYDAESSSESDNSDGIDDDVVLAADSIGPVEKDQVNRGKRDKSTNVGTLSVQSGTETLRNTSPVTKSESKVANIDAAAVDSDSDEDQSIKHTLKPSKRTSKQPRKPVNQPSVRPQHTQPPTDDSGSSSDSSDSSSESSSGFIQDVQFRHVPRTTSKNATTSEKEISYRSFQAVRRRSNSQDYISDEEKTVKSLDDTDLSEDENEYRLWKVRELSRLKRDRQRMIDRESARS